MTCKTCAKEFIPSNRRLNDPRPSRYCSLLCWRKSDELKAILSGFAAEKRVDGLCYICKVNQVPKRRVSYGSGRCLSCDAQHRRLRGIKMRSMVMRTYSGENPRCACCGEDEERFLTIDHENNDGNIERKKIATGHTFYRYLINHGFPKGYQVLCYNCNLGRAKNRNACPHNESILQRQAKFSLRTPLILAGVPAPTDYSDVELSPRSYAPAESKPSQLERQP